MIRGRGASGLRPDLRREEGLVVEFNPQWPTICSIKHVLEKPSVTAQRASELVWVAARLAGAREPRAAPLPALPNASLPFGSF